MSAKLHPSQRRNVVFIGHGKVGKTALAEALAFTAGATTRIGKTPDGSSHFDFEPEEVKHESTLKTSAFDLSYKTASITILDTPGSSDFLADTQCALRAADAVVLVAGAVGGVRVQGEKAWKLAEKEGIARAVFIGELDKENSSFEGALDAVQATLGIRPIVVHLPLDKNGTRIVDVLSRSAYSFDASGNGSPSDIPADRAAEVNDYRTQLVEAVSETDDKLLERYLEGAELSTDEVLKAFRSSFARGQLIPVFCGSPATRAGISAFLDALAQYFPSPLERTPYLTEGDAPQPVEPDPNKPFAGIVFKTFADPFTGQINLLRVIRGTLKNDDTVYNCTSEKTERVGKLHVQLGREQKAVDEVCAGQIVALTKLKDTHTGNTLCDTANKLTLQGFRFPLPSIGFAIEPKSRKDEDKIFQAIQSIGEEDPSIALSRDSSTRETLLSGRSHSHIEITLERVARKYHVEVLLHEPKIPYRETILKKTEAQGRHKKQTGGHGQFGDCWLRVAPKPRGSGFEFKNEIFGGAIPRNFIPAVEKGTIEALERGYLAGYPIVDIEVTVFDGSYHPVDSNELSFKLAASKAIKVCMEQARPTLLEPIMTAEVTIPEDFTGAVVGDLNSRRGRVVSMDPSGHNTMIKADVPMSEMLTYASTLRSITQDRGAFTMEYKGYEEVPSHLAEKIIANAKKAEHPEEEE